MSGVWDQEVRKNEFELLPAGNHFGTVVALIDAGTHEENDSKTGAVFEIRKCIVGYELTVNKKDGTPHYVAETCALSLSTGSKLYRLKEKLCGAMAVGQVSSVRDLLGRPCLVEITHTEGKSKSGDSRTYSKLNGISSVPQGSPAYPTRRPPLLWSVCDGTPLPDLRFLGRIYGDTPEDIIKTSREFRSGSVPVGPSAPPPQAQYSPPLPSAPPAYAPPPQGYTPPPMAQYPAAPPASSPTVQGGAPARPGVPF